MGDFLLVSVKLVFGEHPENALTLYNAINGTEYTNVEDLEITTLRDAVYIGIKNDVSFLFNHDMNLYEHQSTYCPNMPLRGLGYFADLYQIYLGGEEVSRARLYDKVLVEIPAPKYYVFYNGTEERKEAEDLYLSKAYPGEGDIEIRAHMININAGHSRDIKQKCKALADYSELINRIRENRKKCISKEKAVETAIDSCIKDGVLDVILRKERAKVANALYTALTEEEIEELRRIQMERATKEGFTQGYDQGYDQGSKEGYDQGSKEGYDQGSKEGYDQGSKATKFEDVDKLTAEGTFTAERACEILGVEYDSYREYKVRDGQK